MRRYILTEMPCKEIASLIGAPREKVRYYLQAQFTSEMSWSNYGKVWHIDHIAPVSLFDLTNEKERALAWHHLNLRPEIATDNRNKGGSIHEAKAELETRLRHAPDNVILQELCARVVLPEKPKEFYAFLLN